MTTEQEKFITRVKASLDASVYTLDNKTQTDLTSIRKKVLHTQYENTAQRKFNAWLPAGVFAFCALLTAALLYSPVNIDDAATPIASQQAAQTEQAEQVAMLELLTNPEDLEAATDPVFYIWMDEVLATEDIGNAV